jgi:tetratricopeptide (TPR) repeat protein
MAVESTLAFDERIDILFQELELAIRWDRPSILLAIYASEFMRADAEAALAERIAELKQKVITIQVNEEHSDIPQLLIEYPERSNSVFFVSGLHWGGGIDGFNTYRALNIRREYLVEERIRVVFWLTETEAIALPHHAPDFWAFRHRVVEFVEAPVPEHITRLAKEITWRDLDNATLLQDTDAKITLREALLADLPEEAEYLAARTDLLFTLAALYAVKNETGRAIEIFQQTIALAKQLDNPNLLRMCQNGLGNVYSDQGRYNEAIAEYLQAIALDPNYAAPHNGLGNVYSKTGRYDKAIVEYKQTIALEPKFALPHNGLGNVFRHLGRYDEAIAKYQRAIVLDPKDALPHNGLGNVYGQSGRYDEAIANFQQAITLDPKDALPHNGLGNVYRQLGRYDEAIAEYQQAIALDPKYAAPHNGLGNIYRQLDRCDEAIAEYQQAIALDPKYAAPHNGLGNVYRQLDRYDDAIAAYQQAIALDPKDAAPHNGLGNIYRQLDRYDDAIAEYQQAIALDPKYALPHNGLGNVYRKLDRYEEASAEYQQAIQLDPTIATAHSSLAACYRKLGLQDKFAQQIEIARPLFVEESEYNRACFASIRGETEEALKLLQTACEKSPVERTIARTDPDFIFIRDDPRFQELVGESLTASQP